MDSSLPAVGWPWRSRRTRNLSASSRVAALVSVCAAVYVAPTPASAHPERSVGTPEQIAWVRRAAGNFVTAELAGNGAGACAILAAPLRVEKNHRTCEQRWDAKLAGMLRARGEQGRLRKELRSAGSARVVVRGDVATIELPAALLDPANRFVWSENCWMLER